MTTSGVTAEYSLVADDPGQWKYGVRVTDEDGQTIGEDDPWLRVTL
jgi:hypothetical protein